MIKNDEALLRNCADDDDNVDRIQCIKYINLCGFVIQKIEKQNSKALNRLFSFLYFSAAAAEEENLFNGFALV